MFHLFTLQGQRIDAKLEHLPKNIRVHHTKSNSRVRKYSQGIYGKSSGDVGRGYAEDTYREMSNPVYEKSQVFHASEIMSSPVFTIGPDIAVSEAWKIFTEKKVHHMPVVSGDDKLIGIISDRDLLRKIILNEGGIETSVDAVIKDIMSEEVIATTPLTDMRRIAKGMLDHHISAMPVVDETGSIIGIITRSDILFAIINNPDLNLWA